MRFLLPILLATLVGSSCSVRRFAINRVADALASGGSTFENDDDLVLVGNALPFGLKMYESLLAENPAHGALLLAACQGFASYSYVYVHNEADRVADDDLARSRAAQMRARRLYLRALGYCQRSLDVAHPGISAMLVSDPKTAVNQVREKEEAARLYWTAVALGLAISVSKNDTDMLARVPEVEALIGRAVQLDPSWKQGALPEFQITFAGAKPGQPDYGLMTDHYLKALELSQGTRAGVYVAYAEAWAIPQQNRAEFESLLRKALAVDPDYRLSPRLPNAVAHERARWLLERIDVLVGPAPTEEAIK